MNSTSTIKSLAATLALCLAGQAALAQPADSPLKVVATVGMIGDVAREVGGACVDVEVLMGPGSDPHLFRASAWTNAARRGMAPNRAAANRNMEHLALRRTRLPAKPAGNPHDYPGGRLPGQRPIRT